MGIAGGFAGDRAQAKALRRIERGALDAAIVERDALGLAVFQKQLAVIHAEERLADQFFDAARFHSRAVEKQIVGHGKIAHSAAPGCGIGEYAANMVARWLQRKAVGAFPRFR